MHQPHVIEFKNDPIAFQLKADNHPEFIDSITKYGWLVVPSGADSFDLSVVSPNGSEIVDLWNGDYLVLHDDNNNGRYDCGEPYEQSEFEGRFNIK